MDIYREIKVYTTAPFISELDRLQYLVSLCEGKSVLHVGCADAPIASDRIATGCLLHQRIEKVAKETLGIDIDDESIQLLREHGITSVCTMNAENMNLDRRYDVVLAGDVLEHMSNPGLFLQQVPNLLSTGGELIIAVPSAFTFNNIRVWLKKKESVHKDHCFYFSPKCLAQLCERYSLFPTKLAYTVQPQAVGESKTYCRIRNTIVRFFPTTAPAIIMHFKQKSDIDHENYRVL